MSETPPPATRRKPVKEFFTHLVRMPPWQRKLLVGAFLLACVGLLGQSSKLVARAPARDAATDTRAAPAAGERSGDQAAGRSFMSTSETSQAPARVKEPPPPDPTMIERLSPWASRVGFGFVGGFIIGWAFRAFLKTMAIVTATGIAIFWGLSHFNVINLDIEGAETKFKDSTSWVSQQAERLKDQAMTLIPSSFTSLFGAFLGFRRR